MRRWIEEYACAPWPEVLPPGIGAGAARRAEYRAVCAEGRRLLLLALRGPGGERVGAAWLSAAAWEKLVRLVARNAFDVPCESPICGQRSRGRCRH